MPTQSIHLNIAMHGVTGRMGSNQHFRRSILPIMKQGGIETTSGKRITISPILIGREREQLRYLAEEVAVEETGRALEWSQEIDAALSHPAIDIIFDSASTNVRGSIIRQAAECGKAIYCEKPVATDVAEARKLAEICEAAGIKNGVVQDKLWLPGICKLRNLIQTGFFGGILGVKGEFGYWVFTGHNPDQLPQRPSWNYRKADGGGMVSDMFCHWQYLISDLFGPIDRVLVHATTDMPERIDEDGKAYQCTADDSAYAIFITRSGVTCQFNCSWTTRVRRDDLLTIQVDGTQGSAVAGLRDCHVQSLQSTPRPIWDPDAPQPINFYQTWNKLPDEAVDVNPFKTQWELFLRHVADDVEFPWSIRSGADGVKLAHAGEISSCQQRWVTLED